MPKKQVPDNVGANIKGVKHTGAKKIGTTKHRYHNKRCHTKVSKHMYGANIGSILSQRTDDVGTINSVWHLCFWHLLVVALFLLAPVIWAPTCFVTDFVCHLFFWHLLVLAPTVFGTYFV